MVRITCPECGEEMDDTSRKFCPSCGAGLQFRRNHASAGTSSMILAVTGIILLVVIAAILYPHIIPVLSGAVSSGNSVSGLVAPVTPSSDLASVPGENRLPGSGISSTIPISPSATIAQITSVTQTPIPQQTGSHATCQTVTLTTSPVVTSNEPAVPKVTSQITLAETWIPDQPPADSYISTTPGAPDIDHAALESRIHELINVQRRQNGVSELAYDSFLADIARGHSYDMVLRNYFDHTDPDGKNARARGDSAGYPCIRGYRNYYTEGLAENLYQGYRYSAYLKDPNGTIVDYKWNSLEQIANEAVNGWMNSEGHRKNILDDHFQQEGIGIAFSADDKIYVTENFC